MALLRPMRFGLLGLAVLALAGCLFRRDVHAPSWMKPFAGPAGSDVIVMDVAVLEVPVGDPYVNSELWSAADDQVVAPEIRKRLEENGLRVAKVCGRPPDGLLGLLTSERSNRNARQARKRSGDPYSVAIGPQRETLRYQPDGAGEANLFEQASCFLQITPQLGKDGKVQMQLVPQVQHADRKHGMLSPTIAMVLQTQRSTESFAPLRLDVPIGLNEYILVGAYFDRRESLGFQFFVTGTGERPVQRLLAIRAARMGQAAEPGAPLAAELAPPSTPAIRAGTPLAIP
jgi:hypothetical protein